MSFGVTSLLSLFKKAGGGFPLFSFKFCSILDLFGLLNSRAEPFRIPSSSPTGIMEDLLEFFTPFEGDKKFFTFFCFSCFLSLAGRKTVSSLASKLKSEEAMELSLCSLTLIAFTDSFAFLSAGVGDFEFPPGFL